MSHTPTPLEKMPHLTAVMSGPEIWIKRDDCTGLAMGGNKARQLEYYVGQALQHGADILLTTGAVQSNHVRMTIAAARKMGMKVEVQLEKRVSDRLPQYYDSGNPMLMKIMGAKIHHYPVGEDEDGADNALYERAEVLKTEGATPYVIPLSGMHTPYGALGYVKAAEEILQQIAQMNLTFDAIVLASGSANTHAGLLFGLRVLGSPVRVYGMCVRRSAELQKQRVLDKTNQLASMMKVDVCVTADDVHVDDCMLQPGYGQLNDYVKEAISLTAESEGVLLDPTYTGKAMAGLLAYVRDGMWSEDQRVMFLHTGGTPALFGYPELISE
ncbi:MAG: D-cysteine desulfhydrase family protein [Gammaproteobacteria bacterium]|nr:D-cysteine desulfhydrase family protein [Gammaproteobacteria bacterium]